MSIPYLKNGIAQAYVRPTEKAPLRTTQRVDGQAAARAPIVADRRAAPPVQISLSAEALRVLGEVDKEAPRARALHPDAKPQTAPTNKAAAASFAQQVGDADGETARSGESRDTGAPAAPRAYTRPGSVLDISV